MSNTAPDSPTDEQERGVFAFLKNYWYIAIPLAFLAVVGIIVGILLLVYNNPKRAPSQSSPQLQQLQYRGMGPTQGIPFQPQGFPQSQGIPMQSQGIPMQFSAVPVAPSVPVMPQQYVPAPGYLQLQHTAPVQSFM